MGLYEGLVRHVLDPLDALRTREWARIRYLREFEETQFWGADRIRELQDRRLRTLLDHAARACPFYRDQWRRAGVDPARITLDTLHELPAVTRGDLQRHGREMVAEGWPSRDLVRDATGGSTGTPVRFAYSRTRKLARAAATIRHNRWAGLDIGDKVAYVWGAPRDLRRPPLRTRIRRRILDRFVYLDAAHLDEQRFETFHRELQRFRPRGIIAYARALVLFARYLAGLGKPVYRPHTIITSAEVLEPEDRALLEATFGCPVFNRYGCREVSVIASECDAHRGLHVMAEGLVVEVIRSGRPAAPGELGAVHVTDLLNPAMPLIRYRIGDTAALAAGDCPCGRGLPRLERLAGRVTDFLVGEGGRLVSGVFLVTYVVAQRPSLGQVRILQDRENEVLYQIRPGPGFDAVRDVAFLVEATREHLGTTCRVSHELVERLEPETSGKYVFSRSRVAEGRF